jgi:hypothetical protein|eukprot:m.38654 g.38654  ORF g.38654 m.38654 type:complete len:71 (+) comp13469_c1_seq1:62-274(+)
MSSNHSTLVTVVNLAVLALAATPSLVLAQTTVTCAAVLNGGFDAESVVLAGQDYAQHTPTGWTSAGTINT